MRKIIKKNYNIFIFQFLLCFSLSSNFCNFLKASDQQLNQTNQQERLEAFIQDVIQRHTNSFSIAMGDHETGNADIACSLENRANCFEDGKHLLGRQILFSYNLPQALQDFKSKHQVTPESYYQQGQQFLFGSHRRRQLSKYGFGLLLLTLNTYLFGNSVILGGACIMAADTAFSGAQEKTAGENEKNDHDIENGKALPAFKSAMEDNLFLLAYYFWGKKNPDHPRVHEMRKIFETSYGKEGNINHFDLIGTYLSLITKKAGEDTLVRSDENSPLKSALAEAWKKDIDGQFTSITTPTAHNNEKLSEMEMAIIINRIIYLSISKAIKGEPLDQSVPLISGINKFQEWIKTDKYLLNISKDIFSGSTFFYERFFEAFQDFSNPDYIPGDMPILNELIEVSASLNHN